MQDGSNSTVRLANISGAVVASYAYDTFGNPAVTNTTPANPFTYTGREFDPKSGLYYYRSRYYAPDQGRFLSEDPIAHLNAYTYTQNDPIDLADPSGALAIEYQVLTASNQRVNLANCISTYVGAIAGVAAAGVSAAFDQPGAAASAAEAALVSGALSTTISCATAAIPESSTDPVGLSEAFHYTSSEATTSILEDGLRPGTYATPNGGLSPLQAQLELALVPNRPLPSALIRIDVAGLRNAGYEIPAVTRVSNVVTDQLGRVYTMPGGGYEMQFPYAIPPEFLRLVKS